MSGVIEWRTGDSLRDGAFDYVSGKWEREDMGGGLDECLEASLGIPGVNLTPSDLTPAKA